MPHRLTVAGEATAKFSTSKSKWIVLFSLIRSPFDRQSVLLSSNTVFISLLSQKHLMYFFFALSKFYSGIFSIHNASTGPSNTTHLCESEMSPTHFRTISAAKPSVHSWVLGFDCPYNSPLLMHWSRVSHVKWYSRTLDKVTLNSPWDLRHRLKLSWNSHWQPPYW